MNHITTQLILILYQEIYFILTACNFYDSTCNFQWGCELGYKVQGL